MAIKRAYSVLEIKSIDEDQRIIEGIATTPTPDRMEDIVEPDGLEFKLPIPFLYQHNARQPIGSVISATRTKDGLPVVVKLAPPGVAQYIDEAWALIKAKLVRGLSIGFRALEESYDKTTGGFRYIRSELLEISAVTIPANAEATITAIKSADLSALAALGRTRRRSVRYGDPIQPGVSGQSQQGNVMKTLLEQIAALEAKRQANVARQEKVRAKTAEEGRLMDEAEAEEFDTLGIENAEIDKELDRLRRHQKQIDSGAAVAVTSDAGSAPDSGSRARGASIITHNREPLAKGTSFVRLAMAMLAARGERGEALDIVRSQKGWKEQTPEVERFLANASAFRLMKDTAAAGTTTTSHWASELADYTYMASEFIEYLRPQTIIGRIPSLRRVPFNIKIPLQDSGSSVTWVGEGLAKPVTGLTFDTTTLRFAKCAGIVVLTEELVRFSSPSAESLVRTDLTNAVRQFLDAQFVDPTVVVVANVSPASITNGAGNAAASGTTADDFRYDLQLALQQIIAANIDPAGVYIIMQSSLAVAMSLMRNALGGQEFPGLTPSGGTLEGYTCITSQSVPSGVIIVVQPSEIMIADDGGVRLDVSREATITMDDGTSPAVTTTVNLWQNNMVGLRVEREINWARRRAAAVYYITSAAYTSATSPA